MDKRKFKINITISDFPIFRNLDYSFKIAKESGADGVELVSGFKCHRPFKSVKELSQKYNLPVFSIHMPIWTGINIFPDFSFFKLAKELKTKYIVLHPLPHLNLDDVKSLQFFRKIHNYSKKYKVKVLLENLPNNYQIKIVDKYFPAGKDANNLSKILKIAEKYDFGITFDTTHLELEKPQEEEWFKKVLPKIKNIHLSSFTENKFHLPLYMGNFKTKDFIDFLIKNSYDGLITLEIFHPRLITFTRLNLKSFKESIGVLKSI